MAFDLFPSIMESFIYNYADNTWHRYFRGTDGEVHLEENKDYSQALRCHLHTLLKLSVNLDILKVQLHV
jgi:hypothetical protein